jgi:hypothetical protein
MNESAHNESRKDNVFGDCSHRGQKLYNPTLMTHTHPDFPSKKAGFEVRAIAIGTLIEDITIEQLTILVPGHYWHMVNGQKKKKLTLQYVWTYGQGGIRIRAMSGTVTLRSNS